MSRHGAACACTPCAVLVALLDAGRWSIAVEHAADTDLIDDSDLIDAWSTGADVLDRWKGAA